MTVGSDPKAGPFRPHMNQTAERSQDSSPYDGSDAPDIAAAPQRILTIDVGGSKIKVLATGQSEPRKTPSGECLTPTRLVEKVRELTADWEYDVISVGYPGLVGEGGPSSEPGYLGPGWVGFDYAAAFQRAVRICNDAAMQALGSYDGGRMLFIGLGTGVGSALIIKNTVVALELGSLPYASGTLYDVLGQRGLDRLGKPAWRAAVSRIAPKLLAAFRVDYVVLGGGNAERIRAKELPPGIRLGHNLTAFRGGFRLWRVDDVTTQGAGHIAHLGPRRRAEWRLL
jgi:polyphosphate glucokinase